MEDVKDNTIPAHNPILTHLARLEEKQDSQSNMLVNIYKELTGGEFNQGVYETVKKNTSDINRIDRLQQDDHKIIEELRTIKKWSIKAAWVGFMALLAKVGYWVWEILRVGWKAAPALVDILKNHNHNV